MSRRLPSVVVKRGKKYIDLGDGKLLEFATQSVIRRRLRIGLKLARLYHEAPAFVDVVDRLLDVVLSQGSKKGVTR